MNILQRDINLGLSNEQQVLEKINNTPYFGENIIRIEDKYSKYDYENELCIFELKSRNCKYDAYPTTMIAQDKILNTDKIQIFLFNFTDGLYYIKYSPKKFLKFEVKEFQRFDRFKYVNDIKKNYIYIPIIKLKKIC